MTKKKVPSQLLKVASPAMPQNAIQRADVREHSLITGFLSNRKQGAPLKLHNNPKAPQTTQVSAPTSTTVIAATAVATNSSLKTSTALCGTMSSLQRMLLNPTVKDVQLSDIIDQFMGEFSPATSTATPES